MDIEINITVSTLNYITWLRTSYTGLGITSEDGVSMIMQTELGVDQEDAFENFLEEASREVLSCYSSRQGDVSDTPFEHTDTNIIYRVAEGTPALPTNKTTVLTEELTSCTKYALYAYVAMLWFSTKSLDAGKMAEKYAMKLEKIEQLLYQIHD